MDRLADTILENLDVPAFNAEECPDSLYYLASLLEKEENPEHFIKYQFLKLKVEARLNELKNYPNSSVKTL